MEQNIIDTNKEKIELLTYTEVCEIMGIKSNTFYRYYNKQLTAYRNAERLEDKRKYYCKKEVLNLLESRKRKPTKVIITTSTNA